VSVAAGKLEESVMKRALRAGFLVVALAGSAALRAGDPAPEAVVEDPQAAEEARRQEAIRLTLEGIEANMVPIAGGEYRRGDLTGRGFDDELPVRKVTIPPFRLSKYEVTFEQYDTFARAVGKPLPGANGLGRGTQPVINVNWRDAQDFVEWLNMQTGLHYRLPSESEWEYAARAGSSTVYPWGDTYDATLANGSGKSSTDLWNYTAPVGSFPPNAWGLYDMIGNVWEWTQDCYEANYADSPVDGRAATTELDCVPVIRGGGWSNDPANLRSSDRSWHAPEYKYYFLGFRIARDEDAAAPPAPAL
jgi:formylglycine-generating enzyme required for sulfatase activity